MCAAGGGGGDGMSRPDSTRGGRRRGEGGGAGDGRESYDTEESGRTSSRGMVRSTGSRPGSRLGSRPPSSLRRGGLDHRSRERRGVDLEVSLQSHLLLAGLLSPHTCTGWPWEGAWSKEGRWGRREWQ